MKFKSLLLYVLIGIGFSACSSRETIFDNSNRCSLQTEDITDAFGKVIKKGQKFDECPEMDLDPCSPQYKNRVLLGEITDDKNHSILVCPEVNESPLLPSDYTEDTAGEIDLSEALENEDINATKELDDLKRTPEDEELSHSVNSNRNDTMPQRIYPAVKEEPEKLVKSKSEVKKTPVKKTTKSVVTKTKPKKQGVVKKSPIKKKKAVVKKQPVYKMTLGPFFKGKSYVPYSVKVDFEKNIKKLHRKYSKKQKFYYKFIAYYHVGKGSETKKIVADRAKQLLQFAIWKTKLDFSSSTIILKSTKVVSQAQKIDVIVSISK